MDMTIPSPNSAQIGQSNGTLGDEPASRRDLKERAKDQIRNFALMFVYLWVMFGMMTLHESIVLAQHNIDYRFHGLAVINALVFAKVLLVAEDLRLGHRFDDAPLAYSILVKSFLFGVALICFHILERVLIGMWDGKPVAQSISEVGANKLPGIVSLGIISTVALVPFFILREISRVMGPDKFWSLFFQRRGP